MPNDFANCSELRDVDSRRAMLLDFAAEACASATIASMEREVDSTEDQHALNRFDLPRRVREINDEARDAVESILARWD